MDNTLNRNCIISRFIQLPDERKKILKTRVKIARRMYECMPYISLDIIERAKRRRIEEQRKTVEEKEQC